MTLQATTWQTVGPYFRIGLENFNAENITPPAAASDRVTIECTLLDGNGRPVPDAVIEVWQADANGAFRRAPIESENAAQTEFSGFIRVPTDAEGRFRFSTVHPGQVPGPDGTMQAPHLAVRIMMRGLLKDLVTRMYFPCDAVASDPVLQLVPDQRRRTLIAERSPDREATYVWKIELQGDRETVFFDC
jgi:protocatechuate 3,4-dioxygenase alpha subunit